MTRNLVRDRASEFFPESFVVRSCVDGSWHEMQRELFGGRIALAQELISFDSGRQSIRKSVNFHAMQSWTPDLDSTLSQSCPTRPAEDHKLSPQECLSAGDHPNTASAGSRALAVETEVVVFSTEHAELTSQAHAEEVLAYSLRAASMVASGKTDVGVDHEAEAALEVDVVSDERPPATCDSLALCLPESFKLRCS